MKHIVLILLMGTTPVFAQQTYQPSKAERAALQTVNEHSLMSHIRFLSHDLLEGRAPATRGDVLTITYIAAQMERIGLKPGGDNGTYFQTVPILSTYLDPSASLVAKGGGKEVRLQFKKDFVGAIGNQQPTASLADAELVFVGYGIDAPEQHWNDYKDVDVTGKVLLMMNNDPATDDPKFFGGRGRTYYGRWTYKFEIAAKKGAAGAIIIHTTPSAGYGWNVVENSWSGEQFETKRAPGTPAARFIGWTTLEATKQVLALTGHSLDTLMAIAERRTFRPVPLNITLAGNFSMTIAQKSTANVIGVLEGSDPKLKKEAVVFTAHHDHLGITEAVHGDSINNGALDNATGVSAVLNLAEMFTSLSVRPKRSLVFMTVAAEESGLIGSRHYVDNPTVPHAHIAANINIDGLNIFGRTRDIIFIGYGKSSLDAIVKSVAAWQNRTVKPDQFPEQGSFYRSDQFNFAKAGIPAMYLRSGLEYIGKPETFGKEMVDQYIKKHYHQPSDEIRDDWELSGAVQDVQLIFGIASIVANAPAMPVWNKGDEFEGPRLKSLGQER